MSDFTYTSSYNLISFRSVMHSTRGKLNLAFKKIFYGLFFFPPYMCIWPHSSLCAFLPPPCRVQTPDWHSFWCPLTPNQVSPHTTKVVVPIAWMTDFNKVFTIQCPDKSIPPGISLDWEFLLLYSSALLRFYSATIPVFQHLPALFWSSPFPQLPGLFRSACALPGRAQTPCCTTFV